MDLGNFLRGQEAGRKLLLSVCIAYHASEPLFLPQNYLERAVSSSVMEVFISALNTLFTVVPNMRIKFSKKLGMAVAWDHVLCADSNSYVLCIPCSLHTRAVTHRIQFLSSKHVELSNLPFSF